VFLPRQFWSDGDSPHVAYVTTLCVIVGVDIRFSKNDEKNKDAPGAADAGDFWIGMILSLTE